MSPSLPQLWSHLARVSSASLPAVSAGNTTVEGPAGDAAADAAAEVKGVRAMEELSTLFAEVQDLRRAVEGAAAADAWAAAAPHSFTAALFEV